MLSSNKVLTGDGRVYRLAHLPRCNVTQLMAEAPALAGKQLVETIQGAVQEKRLIIPLLGSVRIELDENIVSDSRRQTQPAGDPISGWPVLMGDFAGFQPRFQAFAPPDTERPRNHQQVTLLVNTFLNRNAAVERARTQRVVRHPINRVHDARLRGAVAGGHGEIRIASQVAQQGNFVVQPAAEPIRARIIERPVPVDKTENRPAIVPAEESVAIAQNIDEAGHAVEKILFALAVMVDVDVHI